MTNDEVRETLEKQLQLLSERSLEVRDPNGLYLLTEAMCKVEHALNPEHLL